jgi:putative OmpL-like beta-barrel porin-2
MRKAFRWRVVIGVMSLGSIFGSSSQVLAQADPAPQSSPDLASRIDSLEKQLADLRSQMEAQKATAAVPVPASAAVASTTPAPTAPAAPSLAGLLGPTTLSGFLDVYYGYNSNQPAGRTTAFRNFDINSGQFGLNMIELVADKAPDATASRVGYHIALGFGQAMNIVNSTEPGQFASESNFDQYLKEGYLEYLAPVGKGLQINVGKFVTPAGAEVIETKDNWNYSRSMLFALAIPYFHFGASAKYAFNPKFAVTGYLVNGWNNSIDNNSGKTTGFSAAWSPTSKFSFIQNYLVGPEQNDFNGNFRHLSDTVATYTPNSKLMTRLEFRRDMSDQDVFPYRTGLFRDAQNTVTLGMRKETT